MASDRELDTMTGWRMADGGWQMKKNQVQGVTSTLTWVRD